MSQTSRRFGLLLLLGLLTASTVAYPEEKSPELTKEQQLEKQVFELKVQLAQCSANAADAINKVNSYQLTQEQQRLTDEFKVQLKCKEKQTFGWSTSSCIDVPADKK